MNYAEAEEYINQIPRFSKVKSEENVDEILALFGHPEKKFAYIHVAGTNGKGSVCAFLDSMLRMAGKKTGLFTSPHLITTTERMKINGQNISEEAFTEIFEELLHVVKVREKAGHLHPTYFEWLYLMAMLWFGRQGIEYGIIETGLGGRLDATNHIAQPVLTIITSISYDHMEILGSTLTEIAGEKAGILKSGVPVICDGSEPEAMAVIRKRAAILHCPLKVIEPEQVKILLNRGKNIDFLLQDRYELQDSCADRGGLSDHEWFSGMDGCKGAAEAGFRTAADGRWCFSGGHGAYALAGKTGRTASGGLCGWRTQCRRHQEAP